MTRDEFERLLAARMTRDEFTRLLIETRDAASLRQHDTGPQSDDADIHRACEIALGMMHDGYLPQREAMETVRDLLAHHWPS